MKITFSPEARLAVRFWLERDPSRPALRLSFAGGCGALGYRLTPAAAEPRGDERSISADGFTIHVDYKSSVDLDGARVETGETLDDIVLVHDNCVVGGMC